MFLVITDMEDAVDNHFYQSFGMKKTHRAPYGGLHPLEEAKTMKGCARISVRRLENSRAMWYTLCCDGHLVAKIFRLLEEEIAKIGVAGDRLHNEK